MELGSIVHYLQDKTILVIGVIGFLAKILVEKILRVQPNVNKLFLLFRAADTKSAIHRFHNEIIGKEVFRILKEKMGPNFHSFISEKLSIVCGDITREDLGVKDFILRQQILNQTNVIFNLAATTDFDERYDVALHVNTLGAKYVMNFAKQCTKLEVLVHISTAYVCGEREGVILENSYNLGDSLNGMDGLDIDSEQNLVSNKLDELQKQGATQHQIKLAMKDLGIARAKMYGWPNTYVFTKAMGEMVVEHVKGKMMRLVILRPTIVTSTLKEPFPGWLQGLRTIDSLAVAYGKGKMTCFLADLTSIVDLIPADMVVNAMLVAMVGHANKANNKNYIYHVGSSVKNPITYKHLHEYAFKYFTAKPCFDSHGNPIKVAKVTLLNDMPTFHRYLFIRYLLPLKGLKVVNKAFCEYFQRTYVDLNRKIQIVMRLAELYKPYLFFKGLFDDMNTEKLRMEAKEETDLFYFDPKMMNWDDYFFNIHLPGLIKYVLQVK